MRKTGYYQNQNLIRQPQEEEEKKEEEEEKKEEEEEKKDMYGQAQSANQSAGAPIIASFSIV